MLRWRQVQAVADRLLGRGGLEVRVEELDEPWRTLYGRVGPVGDAAMMERELWKATAGLEGRHGLVETVLLSLPGAGAVRQFQALDELAEGLPPVEWVWPSWLPRGMLSLLGAAPGAGKSLVALDLARRVIHRETFPDAGKGGHGGQQGNRVRERTQGLPLRGAGNGRFPGGNVVYVDAEAVPQIQNERAAGWGMDRSRLYLMLPEESYGLIDFGGEADQDRLLQMLYDLQPHLVVVDSLSSITLKGENNVEDVRAVLGFLSAAAREFDLALLLIHHLRKRGKALPMMDLVTADDFRGSSHIIAMARSVLALSIIQDGPEPDRNGPRRLEVVKTNLCRYPEALGVWFEEGGSSHELHELNEKGDRVPKGTQGSPVPIVRYGEAPEGYREPTRAEACAGWLVEALEEAGEPMRPKDVVALGKEAGYTRATVYRAREKLGEAIEEVGSGVRDPNKRWRLRA